MSGGGNTKPILCLDFDGVIHSYERGWQGGEIYGSTLPGFWEWCEKAVKRFQLWIYSSRSKDPNGTLSMELWLRQQAPQNWQCTDRPTTGGPILRFLDAQRAEVIWFVFAHEKPSAFLTIDDRAIQFKGHWDSEELEPELLRQFTPWNK